MAGRDAMKLDRQVLRMARDFPTWARTALRGLRKPQALWLRLPLSLLLIVGGILSFLPALGIWMLPLGLLLLAQDLPFLQRPMRRLLLCIERWRARRRRRRACDGANLTG